MGTRQTPPLRSINASHSSLALLRLAFATIFTLVLSLQILTAQAPADLILPNADPFITLHPVDGNYLLLATTGRNITIWDGSTIQTAASNSKVVFIPDPETLTQLWSPTLWHIGEKWWIYFTAEEPGKPHAIYVLESDTANPLGTYTFRGPLALGHPAIDPSILTVKGVNYLMFVSLDKGENAIQVARLSSPLEPALPSILIAEPEFPWEKGAGTSKTYPVAEGPTALYHHGKTFVVYSASDTASPAYCLGLLTFAGKDPLDRKNWRKTPHPVFEQSPAHGVYGPGRGTFAESSNGQSYLLYAAKSTDAPTSANRTTRFHPFTWNPDGTPAFGTP